MGSSGGVINEYCTTRIYRVRSWGAEGGRDYNEAKRVDRGPHGPLPKTKGFGAVLIYYEVCIE